MREPGSLILVADHKVYNRLVLSAQLNRLGHQAYVVKSGEEALEAFDSMKFSLVMINCQLSDMDGFETVLELRTRESLRGLSRTPVIAMSAENTKVTRDRCHLAGMDGFLALPLMLDKLRSALSLWLCVYAVTTVQFNSVSKEKLT